VKATYWRCRREVHYILEWYAKIIEEGVYVMKSTISATQTQPRDYDEESLIMETRPKVVAIETRVSRTGSLGKTIRRRGLIDIPRDAPDGHVYICGVSNQK
jgi:hypothetical protein